MKRMSLNFCLAVVLVSFAAAPVRAAAPDVMIFVPQPGADPEDLEIGRWQERARAPDSKADNYERLGWAYIAKARRTLDAGYYKLAEKTADAMDARFGAGAESRLLRGHVLHNLHRFREAEMIARQLAQDRGLAVDFALLSDVLMEQGKLTDAVAACQQMVNLRPGLEAYSRIAHLRWLKGDLPGAIDAMESAARAGSPRDAETSAWTLVRLSSYYLQTAQAPRALALAESALGHASDYPPALLARGRALLALNQRGEAVGPLRRAAELNPLPEYQWWLADALRLSGEAAAAATVETALTTRGEAADPRTLALFLATRGTEPATAVRLARAELANRGDSFTHDALAWALAANGELPAAAAEMQAALAEQTRDARLFLHAGEIARLRGEADAARTFFTSAQALAGTLTPSELALLTSRLGPAAPLAQLP